MTTSTKKLNAVLSWEGSPWKLSMVTALLVLFFLPNMLGGGIGPYAFTITGPFFLVLMSCFLVLHPSFSIRVRGLREGAYFFAMPLLAGVWSVYLRTSNALVEFIHISVGAVTILILLWFIQTSRDIQRLVFTAKIGLAVLTAWGLAEVVIGSSSFPLAGYGNPNYLTTCLAVVTPILWVEALGLVTRPRWSSVVLLGASAATMVLAGSRANLLALTIQGGIVGWQKLSQLETIKSWILRLAFILVVVGSAGGIFQAIISEGERQASLQEQVESERSSALVRAIMIYDGLRLFWESGGLGVGAGNVTYANSSQPYFGAENENDQPYPLHNFPVQLVAQYGILGLLLFGLTYFRLLFGLQRKSADPDRETAVEIVRRSTWAFLVSFILISVSVSYLFNRRPFYFAFGIYLVANQYLIRRSRMHNQETVAQ